MIRDYFSRHELLFQPTTFVSSLSQILPMVSAGLGAAFLPEYMAKDALDSGTVSFVPLSDTPPVHTICLILQANQHYSVPATELMARLKHLATEYNGRSAKSTEKQCVNRQNC